MNRSITFYLGQDQPSVERRGEAYIQPTLLTLSHYHLFLFPCLLFSPLQFSDMTDSWASNSNDATSISMIGSPNPKPFNPEFTYPIFGESETIYGYSKPNISLKFSSNVSIPPLLSVEYQSKNESTTAKIDDIESTLKEFLPEDYFDSDREKEWETSRIQKINEKPLGELVKSYQRKKKDKGKGKSNGLFSTPSASSSTTNGNSDDHRHFEIFRSTWETPGFKEFHRRIQIFALFYIEGGKSR